MTATGYTSTTGDARKVNKAGDTMTGDLVLPDSTPDTSLSAAPKAYVDLAVAGAGTGTPSSTVTDGTTFGQAKSAGAATAYSRGDHNHGTPTLPAASTSAAGVVQLDGTAADIAALGAQAAGTTGKAADAGHVHPTTGVVLTAGDQVINGEKTFNQSIPVFPGFDPEFDNQGARKAYVDRFRIRTADIRITAGNVSLATSVPWAIVVSGSTPLQCSIAAAVGDRIHVSPSFMRTGSGFFVDMAILTSGGAISRYLGSGTSTPLAEGNPAYYPQSGSFPAATGPVQVVVQSGEVDGSGNVTLALVYRGSGTETIYAGTAYPFYLLLTNLGAQPS